MEGKVRIILLGAPGAGKGTQSQVLSLSLGVPHVASGDLFRAARQSGTEIGVLAASYMDRGELIPDPVVIRMVLERVTQADCRQGYILDGFPRTIEQAQALDQALQERGEALDRVLYLQVSPDELVTRLGGRWICRTCQAPYHQTTAPPRVPGICNRCGGELYQRNDDRPETVHRRLEVYLRDTAPLIAYYIGRDILVEVNGEEKMEAVERKMMEALQ